MGVGSGQPSFSAALFVLLCGARPSRLLRGASRADVFGVFSVFSGKTPLHCCTVRGIAKRSHERYAVAVKTLEAQWSPVQHLILGEDPQLRVYAETSVWFKKINLFRQGEDQRM